MRKFTHAIAAFCAAALVGCATQSTEVTDEFADGEAVKVEIEASQRPPNLADIPLEGLSAQSRGVQEEDAIVVTGSRLRRETYDSPQAVVNATPNQRIAPNRYEQRTVTARYPHAETNPIRQTAEFPVSTFSIDVDTAAYSNARRFLRDGQLPPRDAVRVEELINYFDYNYAAPTNRQIPFATHVTVAPSPWAEGRYLMHVALQGYRMPARERPPLNLVLLIDVSGSMDDPVKLPLAIEGFRMLTSQLEARDRVSIVVYAGAAGAVLPPTRGDDHTRILDALNRLQAGGSTAGGQGLALAYAFAERNFDRNAVNRVIIATDGDFNVGVVDDQSLETFIARKRETGIYLSVLGFGGNNYNDTLMQILAQRGNGVAAYIDNVAEARRVLGEQLNANVTPIADDVKIQVEFNPARVAEYRLIGYETRALAREDFNNDEVDAGEINAGHSVTAIYEITPVGGPTAADPLRYGRTQRGNDQASEFGFLRIRYKLPGQARSRLIERPITERDRVASLARAPESTRFAAAVASYGQRLRGDPYLGSFGWSEISALARSARGEDGAGWRREFETLVATARDLTPAQVAER